MIETIKKATGTVLDALKEHPLAVALITINVLFLIATIYVFKETASAAQRRDALITTLVQSCFAQLNK